MGSVRYVFEKGMLDPSDSEDISRRLPKLVETPEYRDFIAEYSAPDGIMGCSDAAQGEASTTNTAPTQERLCQSNERGQRRKALVGIGVAVALIVAVIAGTNITCAKNRMKWSFGQNMYGISNGGRCPLGGSYSWGGDYPSCSIHGELTENEIEAVQASN